LESVALDLNTTRFWRIYLYSVLDCLLISFRDSVLFITLSGNVRGWCVLCTWWLGLTLFYRCWSQCSAYCSVVVILVVLHAPDVISCYGCISLYVVGIGLCTGQILLCNFFVELQIVICLMVMRNVYKQFFKSQCFRYELCHCCWWQNCLTKHIQCIAADTENIKHWCRQLNLGVKLGYAWNMPENVTTYWWNYHTIMVDMLLFHNKIN
jgi:hypothetical protein